MSQSSERPRASSTDERGELGRAYDGELIRAYLLLAGAFLCLTGAGLRWVQNHRLRLPKPDLLDVVLLGLSTARLSRLITRDQVTRPLRAPFTVPENRDAGRVRERPKGSGLVRAAGELITCPRCTAIWAASGLTWTYFAMPAVARFVQLALSSAILSDIVNRKLAQLDESAPNSGAGKKAEARETAFERP